MKKYIQHIQSKAPHERRMHAMQVAGALTAVVFVVWITTLGYRLASPATEVAGNGAPSQTASVLMGAYPQSGGLEVASTSYTGF